MTTADQISAPTLDQRRADYERWGSDAGRRMLRLLDQERTIYPPSGRQSAAWWSTARVLVREGLARTNGYVVIRND